MPISSASLLERIRLGEDSLLELKEVRVSGQRITAPHRDSLANELAAMANSHGGLCVLGVSDDRRIQGIPLEHLDAVEDFVREICLGVINPPLAPVIQRLALTRPIDQALVDADTHDPNPSTSAAVLVIDVPRSLFVHRSPGGYLHRVGSAKREMAPDFLARLFQQRSQARIIRFDEQAVPGASLDDLEPALWQRFASPRSRDDRDVLLDKLGMARPDADNVLRPSVAGVLMASTDPRRWLPNAYIQAVAYRGHSVQDYGERFHQLDAQDITGPLDQQVIQACKFVARNMKVQASKTLGRHDLPQYDLTAVFEALVNAVAHRDYAIYGAKIRLRMFADRLELSSPGAIPNTMTGRRAHASSAMTELSETICTLGPKAPQEAVEEASRVSAGRLTVDSLPYRQAARNEAITSLLAKCQVGEPGAGLTDRSAMMDKRGEGVQLVLERSEALSGQRPVYRLVDDSELLLVIPAASMAQ